MIQVKSVACSALSGTRVAERQIANKSSDTHSQHDPAVVCHEQKPQSQVSMGSGGSKWETTYMMKNE